MISTDNVFHNCESMHINYKMTTDQVYLFKDISYRMTDLYLYLVVQASHQKGSYNILPPLIRNMKWFKITFCTDTFVMNIHI